MIGFITVPSALLKYFYLRKGHQKCLEPVGATLHREPTADQTFVLFYAKYHLASDRFPSFLLRSTKVSYVLLGAVGIKPPSIDFTSPYYLLDSSVCLTAFSWSCLPKSQEVPSSAHQMTAHCSDLVLSKLY